MPFGVAFGIIFQKKTVSEMASKKGTLQHQNYELSSFPEAPREAASRAHFSNKKQEFEHKFQELLLELVFLVVF